MESDLLFTVINKDEWRSSLQQGNFSPESFEKDGYIICIPESELNNYIKSQFKGDENLVLLVIDRLRLHVPIKREVISGAEYSLIYGQITLDAIIDRIKIPKLLGGVDISIRHYD